MPLLAGESEVSLIVLEFSVFPFSRSLAAACIASVLLNCKNDLKSYTRGRKFKINELDYIINLPRYHITYLTGAGDVVASGTEGGAATGADPGFIRFPDGFFQAHIR